MGYWVLFSPRASRSRSLKVVVGVDVVFLVEHIPKYRIFVLLILYCKVPDGAFTHSLAVYTVIGFITIR